MSETELMPLKLHKLQDGSYDRSFWTPEQWIAFGKAGGTVEKNGELNYGKEGFGLGNLVGYFNDNAKGIGSLTNAIGLGLGAYNTFFGQGKHLYDKNMQLLDQNIQENKMKLDQRKAWNDAWKRTEQNKGL